MKTEFLEIKKGFKPFAIKIIFESETETRAFKRTIESHDYDGDIGDSFDVLAETIQIKLNGTED